MRKYTYILNIFGWVFIIFGLLMAFARFYPVPEPTLGVSFSVKYAEELGIEPEVALETILDEIRPEKIRFMSYWNRHEVTPGAYDFSELDWQFELAEKYDVKVLLAIGQRQPRWPECHIPSWAGELEDEEYEQALLDYLSATTKYFAEHPQLSGYHLENEAANRAFGICPDFSNRLLRDEFDTVKQVDPKTPITISVSNQYGIPIQPPIADKYAMSIYRQAHFRLWGRDVEWDYSFVPAHWHRLRTWMIQAVHRKETYIHELQTEPWGESATVNLSLAEQNASMNAERILENIAYAKRIGSESIYLWGAEWWYWRLTEFDDYHLWETVRDEVFGS